MCTRYTVVSTEDLEELHQEASLAIHPPINLGVETLLACVKRNVSGLFRAAEGTMTSAASAAPSPPFTGTASSVSFAVSS